ncbi:MAG: hypothetical protein DI543_16260 [Bradyrhizobium icense]|jgi:hypothetical protein|nr:MAG: hypothetical protein DI543_16260 [Bradyrhizobium icense]
MLPHGRAPSHRCAPGELFPVPLLGYNGTLAASGVRNMNGQLIETPRESFMDAAQKEMVAFERSEREFRKRAREERAEELHLPELKQVILART